MNKEKKLLILTGPTAVGKTALSVGIAKALDGEIISADSMQVYRHMDIGTAKIKKEEMQGIPHHLIDVLEPAEPFHAALFQSMCKQAMEEIYARGKLPIIVGGTGFYIQAVLYDIDFTKTETDSALRKELEQFAIEHGEQALHKRLQEIDGQSAKEIHPHNVKKVIRAIEFYRQTGKRMSEHNEEQRKKVPPYQFLYYVLSLPREILYERINERVDRMREEGLIEEVKGLLDRGCTPDMVSMQGLGYKEMIDAIEGRDDFSHAFDRIKQETRHFAKRQFTWFRREKDVIWLNKEEFGTEEEILSCCIREIKEKLKL